MTRDADNDNWQRHSEFYMPDGTIVLLAESTLFRVYAGSLARHSSVLRGLIDSAQRLPEDAEGYDGCPLVKLHDDPEDVAYFLKAIMGLWDPPMSYSMASSILRFSSKYMVQSLRQQALEHFRRIIPRSYDAIGRTESFTQVFGSDEPHPFQLLPLFREHGLMSFLPWTYYSICALGFEKLAQGDTTHNGKEIRLNEHDTLIALLGWKTLCDMTRETRDRVITTQADDCFRLRPTHQCDYQMRLELMRATTYDSRVMEQWGMLKFLANSNYPEEPPAGLYIGNYFSFGSRRPCGSCIMDWIKREETARSEIWPHLPAIFKLPDWEVLKQTDEM